MEVEVFTALGPGESARILSKLVGLRTWIVFWGRCEARYEGRGASKSTVGDKLVMIKPDRSIIVHTHHGFKPQNWQPDSSSISFETANGYLVMRAVRKSVREVLVLVCDRIYMIAAARGYSAGEFFMYMTEHEIRDVLACTPELLEPGLRVVGVERPVDPGFVDLYGVDSEGRLVIFELKRVKAGEEAVKQLISYIEHFRSRGVDVRGVLAAPDITESAHKMLVDAGLEFRRLDLKSLYKKLARERKKTKGILDYL